MKKMPEEKFLCEMTTSEQIEAHEKNLRAQKKMREVAETVWHEMLDRWIKESEAELARLRG